MAACRQELAVGVVQLKPKTEVEATSILPSLNVKTARSWRGILYFTHLAREGCMTVIIGRRELLAALGGAVAAWPLAARAQQPAMPVIGYLSGGSAVDERPREISGLIRGLAETGYIEGQNVTIEYGWSEGHKDRLPSMAADLVQRRVAVIASATTIATLAAKAATTTTPIVFLVGANPVKFDLVSSLSHPGGNATGVNLLMNELVAKQIDVLHEAVPSAALIGFLVNPINPNTVPDTKDAQVATEALGRKLLVVNAGTEREIDAAFRILVQQQAGALLVHTDPFFLSQREQLVALTARHALPAMYAFRDFVPAGGLMSYGASLTDGSRQVGIYTGRILKGEKPADLPVQQPVKVELVINVKTAQKLGLIFPITLLGRADEVIE
jgi:putative ABC transport system substrate-binding protein